MTRRHVALILGFLASALAAVGCASPGRPGPFASRTTVGTLKTNVARLESERDQMEQKVAQLEKENRKISDELLQERDANGELTARLDDARALLAQQGLDDGTTTASSRSARARSTSPRGKYDDEIPEPAQPTRRKAPFAQVGGIRAVPYPEEDAVNDSSALNEEDLPPPASRTAATSRDDQPPLRWLPVDD